MTLLPIAPAPRITSLWCSIRVRVVGQPERISERRVIAADGKFAATF
jgi:hypothetical protein